MKHYFNPMSRGVVTDWMLRELGVEHEQIVIDLANEENRSSEFLKINPMGKLPVLEDNGQIVTEVSAICTYLADKYIEKGLAPVFGSIKRAAYYRLLFLAGNTVEPALSAMASGIEYPDTKSVGWGDMVRVSATLESIVPSTGWLLGDEFSAVDVVMGGLLDSMLTFHSLELPHNVVAYINRLRNRPAYIASNATMIQVRASQAN